MCASEENVGLGPQESRSCATPYRSLLQLSRPSSGAYRVSMTGVRNHGSRCALAGPADRPRPAGTWPPLLGVQRHTLSPWRARYARGDLETFRDRHVPAGKPLSLLPDVLAPLAHARQQPAGLASYAA